MNKRTSGGGAKGGGDSYTEQAGEPSITSFLLPRLEKREELRPAASKAGGPRTIQYFCSLRRKAALVSPHSVLGSGRPPP